MDAQTAINVLFTAVGILGGWVMNNINTSIASLQEKDLALTEKVQGIELLVAGTYVKRDDMERMSSVLFAKLDRIEEKLDKKADRA